MTIQDAQREIDNLRELLISHCIDLKVTVYGDYGDQSNIAFTILNGDKVEAVEQIERSSRWDDDDAEF